ncbi:MAG: DTW domain-containing protein [Opitutaceae bacterium]
MSSRSVVSRGSPRCERCRYALRWCICEGERTVECPLAIDVLIHHREFWRPTSTGRLINRVIPASRGHVFRHDLPLNETAIRRPGSELWILHPLGGPLPAVARDMAPQVLLLDGSWREAARMMRGVETWGRLVSLPMTGPSRYLLRDQQGVGNYSTAEALLFLLDALGLKAENAALRLQFELHVYAGLRARGEKTAAEQFLLDSPVRAALPELVEELNRRRRRE